MQAEGVAIIDCQFETPHLASMGGKFITYNHYMTLLTGHEYTTLNLDD